MQYLKIKKISYWVYVYIFMMHIVVILRFPVLDCNWLNVISLWELIEAINKKKKNFFQFFNQALILGKADVKLAISRKVYDLVKHLLFKKTFQNFVLTTVSTLYNKFVFQLQTSKSPVFFCWRRFKHLTVIGNPNFLRISCVALFLILRNNIMLVLNRSI
jgi:hypothetical protein